MEVASGRGMLLTLALSIAAAVPLQGSSIAVDPLGRGTWVVDADRDDVVLLPEGKGATPKRIRVSAWPQQLVVTADGTVFVSCRQAGTIDVLDAQLNRTSLPVGAEPRSLAYDPATQTLYAGLVTQRAIAAVTGTQVRTLPLDVEPVSIALYGTGLAVLPRRSGAVTLVALPSGQTRTVALTEEKREAWHGLALAVAGDALVVIHAAVDTGLSQPVPSGGYGGSVSRPIELVASVVRGTEVVVPPAFAMGRALSSMGDCSAAVFDHGFLYLTGRDGFLTAARFDPATLALSSHFSVFPALGTTGVAVAPDGSLRVATKFGEEVVTYARAKPLSAVKAPDLAGWTLRRRVAATPEISRPFLERARVRLDAPALPKHVAEGRALFHTSTASSISGQSGLACATCHPDGREDGLVWRLRGTRRQTPMLAGRLQGTAPFNWEGSARTLHQNIRQTLTRLGGDGLSSAGIEDLAAYLQQGLRAPTLPPVADAALVKRGAEVFNDDAVGCAACHVEAGTDREKHDVASVGPKEQIEMNSSGGGAPKPFDTPSLKYLSLSAPYFHDGQARTLDELLAHNGDKMGDTRALSPEDRKALAAYLASL